MWKVCLFLFLLMLPTMAQSQDSFESDALVVDLATGSYGADLQVSNLKLPKTFLAQIDSVNSGRYDMVVDISSNDVRWKLLTGLAQNEKVLGLDELKIEWQTLHRCADSSLNLTRDSTIRVLLEKLGLKSPRVFVKTRSSDTAYVKVYAVKAPWVEPVRANAKRIDHLEHDFAVMSGELDNLKTFQVASSSSQSKLSLATMLGATTTLNMWCPEASAAVIYDDLIMLRGYGFHALDFRTERDIYDKSESTYDKGWGVGFGWSPRFLGPIWLYGGVHSQWNCLASSELAGDNTAWFRGGEVGLLLVTDHFVFSATHLYGDSRNYDSVMTKEGDFRFSINLGNTWR